MRGPQPWKTERSRVLRSNASNAETLLWKRIRNRQIDGYKFVRQAAIETYYVDFLCRQSMLIVEVDGGTHSTDEEQAYDETRTVHLEQLGYQVLRIPNQSVYENIEGVCATLLFILQQGKIE